MTELWIILRSCGPCVPRRSPHREGPFLVPRAWLSPGFLSAAVGSRVAPVACVHSRKRPDPKGAGLSAARRVALEIETGDSTGAGCLFNCQSSSLHSNALPNPRERLPGPLSLGHVTTEGSSPGFSSPLGEGGGRGQAGRGLPYAGLAAPTRGDS